MIACGRAARARRRSTTRRRAASPFAAEDVCRASAVGDRCTAPRRVRSGCSVRCDRLVSGEPIDGAARTIVAQPCRAVMAVQPTPRQPPAEQQIEDAQRRRLRQRYRYCPSDRRIPGSRSRSRTRRSAAACRVEQLVVHAVQRLAEADAARIVVVDEDRGLDAVRRPLVGRACSPVSIEMPMSCRSHISSSCATCRIANARPDDAVAAIVGRIRQHAPSPPRGIVSQYDVVCICCSGRSSSPDPTFSFV